jgi:transposase
MSKRRYHSVECKNVDWQGLSEQVAGRQVVLAIDVAKDDFVTSILCDEEVAMRVKWLHPQQTRELLDGVGRLTQVASVEAAMEPSGTYGDALRWQLHQRGIEVYQLSPKRVHDAAEVYDGVPSLHDAKAADIIGLLHGQGRSQPWPEPSEEQRVLTAQLTRLRISKQHYQRDLNRLEAQLGRHWPESLRLLDLDSVTLHRLIAAYGVPTPAQAMSEEATALMRRHGGHWLRAEKVEQVLCSAEHTVGVPCLAPERELLQWLAASVLETHQQVRRIEREIEARVADHAVSVAIAQIVGKVTSAVLLAALGDPREYPDADSYCKGMGLNLKERSSGKHKGRLKLTKRGPSVVRFYLYFSALRWIGTDPLIQRWYRAKTQRPGSIKNKSVIELMRKLAKAVWYVAGGEVFEVEKLFNLKAVEGQ